MDQFGQSSGNPSPPYCQFIVAQTVASNAAHVLKYNIPLLGVESQVKSINITCLAKYQGDYIL